MRYVCSTEFTKWLSGSTELWGIPTIITQTYFYRSLLVFFSFCCHPARNLVGFAIKLITIHLLCFKAPIITFWSHIINKDRPGGNLRVKWFKPVKPFTPVETDATLKLSSQGPDLYSTENTWLDSDCWAQAASIQPERRQTWDLMMQKFKIFTFYYSWVCF